MSEKTPKPIEFLSRDVDGATKYFVGCAWPEITEVKADELESLPQGLVVLDGDNLTVTVSNGTGVYLKTGTAEDGTLIFELVEGTFEPLEEPAQPPDPQVGSAAPEEPNENPDRTMVLDTDLSEHSHYVPQPRQTFGQVLSAETAAAFKSGDMTLHAAIHNFEMAAGDFKRAALLLVDKLPPESELSGVLTSIISDL